MEDPIFQPVDNANFIYKALKVWHTQKKNTKQQKTNKQYKNKQKNTQNSSNTPNIHDIIQPPHGVWMYVCKGWCR